LYTFKMCSHLAIRGSWLLRFQLHIIPTEHIPHTLQKASRIKYCCNLFVLKLDEWSHFINTEQFQGIDTAGTHATGSGNSFSPAFWQVSNQNCTIISALVLP
jgi:hypothetical protein